MTKSYYIEDAPNNVIIIGASQNGFIVYCYENDECIHIQHFAEYNDAQMFGEKYLESDWNKTGFPSHALAA